MSVTRRIEKGKLWEVYSALPDVEVFRTSPKREWIEWVAERVMVSPETVKGWLYGAYVPDALHKMELAKLLSVNPDELFGPVIR